MFQISDSQKADLNMSWHIPRPTLARSSTSSQGSTASSNNSTQSTKSGTLLLTAANLAQIQAQLPAELGRKESNLQIYLEQNGGVFPPKPDKQEMDNVSIASSMHFTVINVSHRPVKPKSRSFCSKHQLTILVITMSILFLIGIIGAIFCIESKSSALQAIFICFSLLFFVFCSSACKKATHALIQLYFSLL